MKAKIRVITVVALMIPALTGAAEKLEALSTDCEGARIHYEKGTKAEDFGERARAFEKAVKLCPSFAEAHVKLANAYENLAKAGKKFDQKTLRETNKLLDNAISEYQLALKYKPNLFEGHLGLAENYFRIGLYEKAQRAFEKALKTSPEHALASRAQSGLRATKASLTQDSGGFKTANQIRDSIKLMGPKRKFGEVMGFKNQTAVSTRQSFNNILFNTMSHSVDRPEALAQLQEIGQALSSKGMEHCKFVLEGHTDSRGGRDMNLGLSQRRAGSVKQYLIEKFGIPESKIKSQGFGYERPRVPNDSSANMLKNRRVELIIIQ
jgi:outer membrane protein OmpA-like peptidoglycan-associated protein